MLLRILGDPVRSYWIPHNPIAIIGSGQIGFKKGVLHTIKNSDRSPEFHSRCMKQVHSIKIVVHKKLQMYKQQINYINLESQITILESHIFKKKEISNRHQIRFQIQGLLAFLKK